jgi:L-seryl-tRNA(Ser) seleniumtransferase
MVEASAATRELLRELPSVEVLASRASGLPHRLAVTAARLELEDLRRRLLAGEHVELGDSALDEALLARARALTRLSLRPVINATGVILHTNLGRAPLAREAAQAAALAGASYTNLEYALDSGQRGSRQAHVETPLCELSGAEAALAVNNNAAAVLLALAALAGRGEVVVGRDQLIEIGGSFRIPEILAQSGARLVEVGTTNRTRIGDYERAIGPDTAALLRVHKSNFRTVGFVEEVSLAELCRLGAQHGLPVIDDLGSGAITSIDDEPALTESVAAGAAIVCASADKLLGGPQAGLMLGTADAIGACRRHPLARALRLDKMQLAALETTLRLHRLGDRDAVPVLAMLAATPAQLTQRAERLAEAIGERASVISAASRPGGGSLPATKLPGAACAIDPGADGADALAAALRACDPPIVARIHDGRVLLDPRTIDPLDIELVGELAGACVGGG